MNETPSATAIFAPIWRRKWLVLLAAIIVACAAYVYYKREPSSYQVETKLYLAGGSEESPGAEKATSKASGAAAQTQSQIINAVVVETVKRELKKTHNHIAKAAAKGKVKAKSAEKSQFITVTAEARTPKAVALLANTVAAVYIQRQHQQYERGIYKALLIDKRQLNRIEAASIPVASSKGKAGSSGNSQGNVIREAQLSSKINQLEDALGVHQVEQLSPARPTKALLLGPLPKKNAEFGFVIGLVLAAIAAFLLGRLDRRLRTLADVEAIFHAQILAVLPQVRRPIVSTDGYPRPSRFLIEPLRLLRTQLLLNGAPVSDRQDQPRSILVLSADSGDGRSTIAVDLALVQREAGERAAVLEADFRRPSQTRLLGLPGRSGLPDVLTGALTLEEALQTAPAPAQQLSAQPRGGGDGTTALVSGNRGVVVALPGGAGEDLNPPALLSGPAMTELLRSLGEDYDHVLIDAPSPLEYSDAMPLLAAVDGIVIVARVGHTHERSADRLRQLLAHTPSAPILGVVANGVSAKDSQRYGMATGPIERGLLGRLMGR
jgi:Mrp family chromosome partitioning ATPase